MSRAGKRKKRLPAAEYKWQYRLLSCMRQMLIGREDSLSELYGLCDSEGQRKLVKDLILRFEYVDYEGYAECLKEMAEYILESGYDLNTTGIVAMTLDDKADSSQAVLQDFKTVIGEKAGRSIADCNNFDHIDRLHQGGVRHI